MNAEEIQLLRDEFEPMLHEIISSSNGSEVLQNLSVLASETFEVKIKILAIEVKHTISSQQGILASCSKVFETCPNGKHNISPCTHKVDCNNKQIIDD